MIHNEHFRKADETYEIRHDNNGNSVHVFIKDGEAILFPSAFDLFNYFSTGNQSIERFYLDEDKLDKLYESEFYMYYDLKTVAKTLYIWKEIRDCYLDEDNNFLHIDAWTTEEENDEDGHTIAKIDMRTGEVEYIDERAKTDALAQEIISQNVESILQDLKDLKD